jgi:beta-lactamase regulating signal transducer with metallopeptidase domain
MTLVVGEPALLWQLGILLLSALLIALIASLLQRRWQWISASPVFWWAALALATVPLALAHCLPSEWALPAPDWSWSAAEEPAQPPQIRGGVMQGIERQTTLRFTDLLCAGWLAGLALMTSGQLRGRWRLHRLLAECSPLPTAALPGRRSRRLAAAVDAAGIRLLGTSAPVSPFAHGGCIVLPRALLARLDDGQCWLLLRHEATHLRLRDPAWQSLLAAVVALNWFNPAVRLLANRLRLATELRCDARALGRRKHMRRAYAEAYLEALRMSATRALPCPVAAFSPQNQGHHKMRIGHILSSPARPGKRRATGLCLLALGAGLALTAAQAAGIGNTAPADGSQPEFRGPIISGQISSKFGTERPKLSAVPHRGIDLKAPRGTPVRAPADGVVVTAEAPFSEAPRYGTVVILDHGNGWRTLYAHLDSIAVKRGDKVRSGDTIGGLGSTGVATGPHVHVEVHHDGERMDPASVITQLVAAD